MSGSLSWGVFFMPVDWEVVSTMSVYGGGFVKALARLYYRADPVNMEKIKATWPEYWQEYAEMTELVKAQRERDQREVG